MSREQSKILWLSMFAPISTASSGGSQTFNYYFKKFQKDSDFDIRLITCGKYKERIQVEKELENINHKVILWNNPSEKKVLKLINIESKFNPFNRNANLIANTVEHRIIKYLLEYKKEGYYPDVIILEWTEMVVLAAKIKRIFPRCIIVASEHDVTFIGYRRKAEYYKGIRRDIWKWKLYWEKRVEIAALKNCDLILPHNLDNKDSLILEGVAANKIKGLVPFYKNMSACKRSSNNKDILFFGAMGRVENHLSALWFIENVMPLLENEDIRFVVLGGNPLDELKRHENSKIHITGFVDDIQPYFEKSMCLVAPLVLGAGIKIKVLEAMSSGIPVLTNDIGIEGIPAIANEHYFFCERPEDYATCIAKILKKNINVCDMEKKSKTFVNRRFCPEMSFELYKKSLLELRGVTNDNN